MYKDTLSGKNARSHLIFLKYTLGSRDSSSGAALLLECSLRHVAVGSIPSTCGVRKLTGSHAAKQMAVSLCKVYSRRSLNKYRIHFCSSSFSETKVCRRFKLKFRILVWEFLTSKIMAPYHSPLII